MRIEMVADHFGVHHGIWQPANDGIGGSDAVRHVTALWSDRRWWFYIDGEKFRANFATVEDGARAVEDHLQFGQPVAAETAASAAAEPAVLHLEVDALGDAGEAARQDPVPATASAAPVAVRAGLRPSASADLNRARQLQISKAGTGKVNKLQPSALAVRPIKQAIKQPLAQTDPAADDPSRAMPNRFERGPSRATPRQRRVSGWRSAAALPEAVLSLLIAFGLLLSVQATGPELASGAKSAMPVKTVANPVRTVANSQTGALRSQASTAASAQAMNQRETQQVAQTGGTTTSERVAKGAGELLFPAAHAAIVTADDRPLTSLTGSTTNGDSAGAGAVIALPTRKPAARTIELASLDIEQSRIDAGRGVASLSDAAVEFDPLADHPSRARFASATRPLERSIDGAELAETQIAGLEPPITDSVAAANPGALENPYGDVAGIAGIPPLPVQRFRLGRTIPDTVPQTTLARLIVEPTPEPVATDTDEPAFEILPARKLAPAPRRASEQPRPRRLFQAAPQPDAKRNTAKPAPQQRAQPQIVRPKLVRPQIARPEIARNKRTRSATASTSTPSRTAARKATARQAAAKSRARKKIAARSAERKRSVAARSEAKRTSVRKVSRKSTTAKRNKRSRREIARATRGDGSMVNRTVRRDMRGRRYVELRFRRARTKGQYRQLQQQRNHAIAQLLRRNRARRSLYR